MILSWAFPCEPLLDGGGPEQALKARVEGVAVTRKSRKKSWKTKIQQIKVDDKSRNDLVWFDVFNFGMFFDVLFGSTSIWHYNLWNKSWWLAQREQIDPVKGEAYNFVQQNWGLLDSHCNEIPCLSSYGRCCWTVELTLGLEYIPVLDGVCPRKIELLEVLWLCYFLCCVFPRGVSSFRLPACFVSSSSFRTVEPASIMAAEWTFEIELRPLLGADEVSEDVMRTGHYPSCRC